MDRLAHTLWKPWLDPQGNFKPSNTLLMQRLRAERKGLDTSHFPPRLRKPRTPSRFK